MKSRRVLPALIILVMLALLPGGCDTPVNTDPNGQGQGNRTYTVTFAVDGVTVNTQTVTAGRNATPPTSPTKDGYDFDGWNGDYTNITGDRTIAAKWKEKTQNPTERYYTVTFTVDRNEVSVQQILEGGNAVPPTSPTKDGYDFDGWNAVII
ncbi:MAG: InlB B-repeat-containing protein [Treponema sp.]|jgi:uncharacterized repeat protein (TIGR02543 family)|nr:InlB B-repeat-containing protein [Treponema sp.]